MLVLVWCQIVAAAHATSMMTTNMAAEDAAAEMVAMTGCDGLPDTDLDGGSDCPAEDATSDWGKIPVFAPLPPAMPFALVDQHGAVPATSIRYELPQGRAPPRPRLCSWLI